MPFRAPFLPDLPWGLASLTPGYSLTAFRGEKKSFLRRPLQTRRRSRQTAK
jgi:hypothetical protein